MSQPRLTALLSALESMRDRGAFSCSQIKATVEVLKVSLGSGRDLPASVERDFREVFGPEFVLPGDPSCGICHDVLPQDETPAVLYHGKPICDECNGALVAGRSR